MTHFRNRIFCLTVAGCLAAVSANAGVTTYQYDALGRMKEASYIRGSKATARVISHSYDARGNRTGVAVGAATGPGGGTSNHTPVAVADTLYVDFTGYDAGEMAYAFIGCVAPTANDTDGDNDTLTVTSPTPDSNGQICLTLYDTELPSFPMSYSISDGHGGTASGTITVVGRGV